LARTPTGALFHIDASTDVVAAVLTACDGTRPICEVVSDMPDPDGFADVVRTLAAEGVLTALDPLPEEHHWARFAGHCQPAGDLSTITVALAGSSSLVDRLQPRIDRAGFAAVERCDPSRVADALGTPGFSASILVVALDHLDVALLASIDDACQRREVAWVPLCLDGGKAWLGPAVTPARTSNYRDLLGRRLAVAFDTDVYHAVTSRLEHGPLYLPPEHELDWILGLFVTELVRWQARTLSMLPFHELEADPMTMEVRRHAVFPLPERQIALSVLEEEAATFGIRFTPEDLVDDRTGLIGHVQQITHHPSVPGRMQTFQSHTGDMARLYPWTNNPVCGGSAFDDPERARIAAIGEATERYSGNWIRPDLLREATYEQLRARGDHAVDPASLVLYSPEQHETEGFPFGRFTRSTPVHWIPGWSLTAQRSTWIPASMVYINWYVGPFQDQQPVNFFLFPGIAAGPSLESAILSGIEECIERDATMVWWTNGHKLPAAEPPSRLRSLWEGRPTELGQRAWLIPIDNEFDVPVMAGVVENRNERLLNIGFGCCPEPEDAALKSWSEALTLQEGSRDLLDPNSLFRNAVARGDLDGRHIKPWRADRGYLDDYREDFRDVCDLMCQQQVFLDPRAQELVRPLTHVAVERSFSSLPSVTERSLDSYRRIVEARGYEILYTDVTTPDVALTGISVVRVTIPGLAPNFPAAFPFLGRRRIQQASVDLGWRRTPLAEEELNYAPLPHA
jgi:ribosomal protein S12 methylthiotransferase accessory factor